jgi:hypothetical protein
MPLLQRILKRFETVVKELKQKRAGILMSLVFVKEECTQVLLDFLFFTDIGRVIGPEEAERSDKE